MTRFALLGASALACAALAQDTRPRLTVVPFASLSGEVPAKAGAKAQGMLITELQSADAFVLLDGAQRARAEQPADQLAVARAAVETAQELRTRHRFRLADEALQRAFAAYQTSAAALTDVGELADAWALASAIAYTTGRDEEGLRDLSQALAFAPDREVALARSSPLFSAVVASARQTVKASAQGTLTIETAPANAPVMLDGVAVGASPVTIREVPPGQHLWTAHLASGDQLGGLVEVQTSKPARVRAQGTTLDPSARLLISLAQNHLDAEALGAAKDEAKRAGADYVVFGALSADGKGLALDSFVFAEGSQELRRLSRARFDLELLSAGLQFYAVAGELARQGQKAGEPVKLPASVSPTPLAPGPAVAEVRYGAHAGKDAALDALEAETGKETDGQRAPVQTKRRVPLKRPER